MNESGQKNMRNGQYPAEKSSRGRRSAEDWRRYVRYLLRHLEDPIALECSPLCRMAALERRANESYTDGIVPRGRAIHDMVLESLLEIERDLEGYQGSSKLRSFSRYTREGKGLTEASRCVGVTPEHASRSLKKELIELLTEKLLIKLR